MPAVCDGVRHTAVNCVDQAAVTVHAVTVHAVTTGEPLQTPTTKSLHPLPYTDVEVSYASSCREPALHHSSVLLHASSAVLTAVRALHSTHAKVTAEQFGIQNNSHHHQVRTSMPDGQRHPMSPCCACLTCRQLCQPIVLTTAVTDAATGNTTTGEA
eukprot:20668-Heterococcus_DN1.PRE.2